MAFLVIVFRQSAFTSKRSITFYPFYYCPATSSRLIDQPTRLFHSSRHDPGARFAFESASNVLRIGDQGLFTARLQEPEDGLDLRGHRSFGEVRPFRPGKPPPPQPRSRF